MIFQYQHAPKCFIPNDDQYVTSCFLFICLQLHSVFLFSVTLHQLLTVVPSLTSLVFTLEVSKTKKTQSFSCWRETENQNKSFVLKIFLWWKTDHYETLVTKRLINHISECTLLLNHWVFFYSFIIRLVLCGTSTIQVPVNELLL